MPKSTGSRAKSSARKAHRANGKSLTANASERQPQSRKAVPGKTQKAKSAAAPPTRARKIDRLERRQAILDAALTVFAECGFEAARLDDVAARAGVAKGTLYLYVKDKESLLEEVIRTAASPVIERLDALAAVPDLPFETVIDTLFAVFEKEILGTRRKLLIRLILTEGPRFPRIAEFHYRNVVARVLPLVRKLAERAVQRGELQSDALVRFPQLIAAPIIVTVIWDALFARIKPLDTAGFFRAYADQLLTAKPRKARP